MWRKRFVLTALSILLFFMLLLFAITAHENAQLTDKLALTKGELSQTQRMLTQRENELSGVKKTLTETKIQLSQTKQTLISTQDELSKTKEILTKTEVLLGQREGELLKTKRILSETTGQLRKTRADLENAKTRLSEVEAQFTALNTKYQDFVSWYAAIRDEINMRGGVRYHKDSCKFITPAESTISSLVQQVTGGFSENVGERWADIRRLYTWTVNNIEYATDSYTPILPHSPRGDLKWRGEFWRMPSETLADKAGDCEDMAILLASMLLNYYEQRFRVYAIVIHSPLPDEAAHMAVAIPVKGNELTILDPAGNFYTEVLFGWLCSKPAHTAIAEWLAYWSSKIPNAQVVRVFSDKEEHIFDSTDEFLKWLRALPELDKTAS
jgi:hypothetical protein